MCTNVKEQIKFGTDGWRAVIGDTFTFANVRILTQAVCDYIHNDLKDSNKEIVIGYDTRFLSDKFAASAAEVFAANGIKVLLSKDPVPTPVVSYATRYRKLCLGIVITASHNPPEFNGYKIKDSRGGSADASVTKRVEELLDLNPVRTISLKEAIKNGSVNIVNLEDEYIKFIRSYLDMKLLRNARFNILQDVMYGSGNGILAKILRGTKLKLSLLHDEINPSFGGRRPEPVKDNLSEIISRMENEKFHIGLVLDGDADRIAAIEPGGAFIHPQQILVLLLLHLKEDRKWDGGVVKTIAGTTMIDKVAKKLGVKLYETPVGFKYISSLMEKENILVGGEEAGGMGFKNYIPERDGTLAGLLLTEMMAYRKKNISKIVRELEKEFGKYYYYRDELKLVEVAFNKEKIRSKLPDKLLNKKIVEIKDYDGIKMICENEDWLMLRGSGTEPILRIYAEAKSLATAKKLVEQGKKIVLGS